MKTIEICDRIDTCDYEQFEEDGTDIEDVCETLATAYRNLYEAAKEVLVLECSRVNSKGGEPYDPIANPGQFDFRITNLAKILES
jgi:hypothetical protein